MPTNRHSRLALAALALGLPTSGALAQNPTDTVAYAVAPGTAGNQAWPGPLGLDFNVLSPIEVTQLGAFAPGGSATGSGSYLFTNNKVVSLYDRTVNGLNPAALPLVTVTFTGGTPYTLTAGNVFQALAAPLLLPTGFQGMIVAKGYGNPDFNYNSGGGPNTTATENSGGGLIQFVGTSDYDYDNAQPGPQYPTQGDGGPEDRYDAGTFSFTAAPEPPAFAGLALGALGLAGMALKSRRRNAA